MNDISVELNILMEKMKGNKKILKFSENITLPELKKVCDTSNQMITILEFDQNSYSIAYLNKIADDFFGFEEEDYLTDGYGFILKTTHPDNIDSVSMLVKFFNDIKNRKNTFTHTLYLNIRNNWEWLFSIVKPATYNTDGSVKYLVSVTCSLDHLMDSNNHNHNHNHQQHNGELHYNNDHYQSNVDKFNSLSDREKEVLKLIAEELTSKEIANILFISPLTVDTHRKHLIEKLGVKSSIGLIKYALMFELI